MVVLLLVAMIYFVQSEASGAIVPFPSVSSLVKPSTKAIGFRRAQGGRVRVQCQHYLIHTPKRW